MRLSPSILIVTPIQWYGSDVRLFGRALQSVYKLDWKGQLDHFQSNGGDNPMTPSENVAGKYALARNVFLAGSWTHMLCAESDMIVPSDALNKLAVLDADIAYALYVWRHGRREWSAYTELEIKYGTSVSKNPALARSMWGQAMDVAGVGQGCTLIARHVIEALPFRNWKGVSSDWVLAYDAQQMGYKQVCDLSVVCGHMSLLPSPQIIWPDPNEEKLHRVEFLG